MSEVVLTRTGATAQDLAWAAGLFEGEGCISKQTSGGGRYAAPRCQVTMSDEDVVRRLHSVLGVGSVQAVNRKKVKASHKDLWAWTAAGFPSTQYVIALLWKWLGTRRREKAEEILNWAKTLPAKRKAVCKRGHSLTDPSNVNRYEYNGRHSRICRACVSMRSRSHYLLSKKENES